MDNPNTFSAFSLEHFITLGVILLFAFALIMIARSTSLQSLVKPVSYTLAILLIGHELIWFLGVVVTGQWHYSWGLPLQLCDLAIFAVGFVLIRHHQMIWEVAYFWTIGGSLQAILTPDLTVTFPHYVYIKFFLSHGVVIAAVLFLAIGCRRLINFRSVIHVFVITNVYVIFVGMVNWVLGTNYLYLCERPTQSSILDYLGDGIYYYLGFELIFVISLLFCYLPYFIIQIKTRQ